MDQISDKPTTIDAYISLCPSNVQPILQKIRTVIHEAAPLAVEKISYQMPAFFQNGDLVYFALQKGYIGFYPTGSGIEAFKEELSSYTGSKGSVHFPLDRPIPYDLISRITKFRVEMNQQKGKKKKLEA